MSGHTLLFCSVLGIGYFKSICTISQFNVTGHIVPTRGRPDSKEMFPDLEAAMFLLHVEDVGKKKHVSCLKASLMPLFVAEKTTF